jgi:membrane associated rhomboid family serine protease
MLRRGNFLRGAAKVKGQTMTTCSTAWPLSSHYTTRPLRSTLFASTALFAVYLMFETSEPRSTNLAIFTVSVVYAFVLMLLLSKQHKNKITPQVISVDGNVLIIPRVFSKSHHIYLHEIKSVEKSKPCAKNLFVLIGRYNKSTIFIDRLGFSTANDFENFAALVAQLASKNQTDEYSWRIASITARNNLKSQFAIIIISLTWLALYALVCTSGIDKISDSAITKGALTKDTLKLDELYRLASSFFLHLNPIHLGLNVLTFSIISRNIELMLGRVRMVNILFLSAVTGSLISWAFSSYSLVIGASGGILGLLGAYFVICVRYPRSFPGSVSTSGRAISLVLILQLCSDITIPGVDIFSHIGGLVFGITYAYLISGFRTLVSFDSASPIEFRVSATASCLYLGGLIYFLALYINAL